MTMETISNNRDAANRLQLLTQKCLDVSQHLYTVSESVFALLSKALNAQAETNQQAADMLTKCTAVLKKTK